MGPSRDDPGRYTEEQYIAVCVALRWTYLGERRPCEMPALHWIGDPEGRGRRRPLGYCDVHWDDVVETIRVEIAGAEDDAWIIEAVLARAEHEYERRRAAVRAERAAASDRILHLTPGDDFVYIVRAGADGPVKIGTSRDPRTRILTLQTGCPEVLEVLAVVPGGRALETALHLRFSEHRRSGEWFDAAPEVLDFAAELALRTLLAQ